MNASNQAHTSRSLAGKTCLVTGGANGIGYAIALMLADHGASVYVCDNSREHLNRAEAEVAVREIGSRLVLSECDVTDRSAVEAWIAGIVRETGRVDVLVNNAAFIRWQTVDEMTVEDAELSMAAGYNAIVYTTNCVLPLMRLQGSGNIVNIGSAVGKVFNGGTSAAYAAAKAAIEGYTAVLYQELRGTGITATVVRPGAVGGTDFFGRHVSVSKMPRMADFIPCATPPQVATGVLRAITGKRRAVNIPSSLSLFFPLYAVAPGFLDWLTTRGRGAKKQIGHLSWTYPGDRDVGECTFTPQHIKPIPLTASSRELR